MEVDNKTCSENVAYVSVTLLLSKDAESSGCIHTARVNPVQTWSRDIILFITIFYSFCSHHISSSIWNTQLSITLSDQSLSDQFLSFVLFVHVLMF